MDHVVEFTSFLRILIFAVGDTKDEEPDAHLQFTPSTFAISQRWNYSYRRTTNLVTGLNYGLSIFYHVTILLFYFLICIKRDM
jgi:hypothetical protein